MKSDILEHLIRVGIAMLNYHVQYATLKLSHISFILTFFLIIACDTETTIKRDEPSEIVRDMNMELTTDLAVSQALDMSMVVVEQMDMFIEESLDMEMDREQEIDMEPLMEVDLGPDNGINPEFVMNSIELLPVTEGFDLDGDGMPNNGLALLFSDPLVGRALGGDPNEYIARSVRRGDLLLLLDFNRFDQYQDDDYVNLDIFLGRDTDDRRRNNFNGSQDFSITCSSLTSEGEPESRFSGAQLSNGLLSGTGGQFRFLVSFSNTEVLLKSAMITGQMNPDGSGIEEGMLGGAVSFMDLEEVVVNDPEIGPAFAEIMLNFLRAQLDIDLDQDGVVDALSASFKFTAVTGLINRDQPCVE